MPYVEFRINQAIELWLSKAEKRNVFCQQEFMWSVDPSRENCGEKPVLLQWPTVLVTAVLRSGEFTDLPSTPMISELSDFFFLKRSKVCDEICI